MSTHFLYTLAHAYPQLVLPIDDATRHSEAYRRTVLGGDPIEGEPQFSFSPYDRFETVDTPAGQVAVISLHERADFEHCIRALAHRCENADIPATMGASTISGLINWQKIHAHMDAYVGEDADEEFERFTAVRENYRDTVIVLSRGYYSALPPAEAGFPEEEWVELSYTIRKYHELAHFFSQRLYPANKEAVRDEVLADMNGIIAALGRFDAPLERKLLGIRNGAYTHGRLQNYVEPEALSAAVERVNAMLDALEQSCTGPQEPFAYLRRLEEEKTFLG